MFKRNLSLFLIIIFIIGLAIFGIIIDLQQKRISEKEKFIPSDRAATFTVSGGKEFPIFTKELIVDPIEPRNEEKQIFSIWAKDPKEIKKVIATIKTDKEDEMIELRLIEGTRTEGRWQGFWITRDLSPNSRYQTVFQAINKKGEKTIFSFPWDSQEDF